MIYIKNTEDNTFNPAWVMEIPKEYDITVKKYSKRQIAKKYINYKLTSKLRKI